MAGDWMKIDLELPDKPEVHAMAGSLNLDPDSVVGRLIRVWQWFDKHTTDGNAHGVTFALVDRLVGVTGFGEAMMLCGWLEQHDKTLHMPRFDRHTSKSAKKRALSATRQEKHRSQSDAYCNAESVTKTSPREEKRREEVNTLVLSHSADDVIPPCPQQKLLDLYAEMLPTLPQPRAWEGQRQQSMRARWRWVLTAVDRAAGTRYATTAVEAMDFFRRYFAYVAESDFLMARTPKPWRGCDLEWLLKSENFDKVLSGKYENVEEHA